MILYFIKSGCCLLVLLLLYHLLLKREQMYWFNRYYLLFALVFSFIAPLVNIPSVGELFVQQEIQFPVLTGVGTSNAGFAIAGKDELSFYYLGYYVLASLFLIRFVIRLCKLYRKVLLNERTAYKGISMVLLKEDSLPYTFLKHIFVNKYHYLHQQIETELLTHETAHVVQKHSYDVLFVECLRVLLWWNPLLYYYKKAITLNHEFLADAYVLEHHANLGHYQELLLNKAARKEALVLSSPFNFTITKRRLKMMTKRTSRSRRRMLALLTLSLFACLFLVVANKAIAQTNQKQSQSETISKDRFFEHAIIGLEKENGLKVYKSYASLNREEKAAIPAPPALPNGELKPLPKDTFVVIYADGRVLIDTDGITLPPAPPAPPVLPTPPALSAPEVAPVPPVKRTEGNERIESIVPPVVLDSIKEQDQYQEQQSGLKRKQKQKLEQ